MARLPSSAVETAWLTDRRPGAGLLSRARARNADAWAHVGFAVLCVGFAIGFFVFPTYPNYDSYYSLLWGREALDGTLPHFEGFRVPTEHPLAIVVGAVLTLFGDVGDRMWVFLILASYLGLVAGVYRLGRIAFTPLVGLIAAVLLLTRFDFAFLAARGYIDVPYMALVVWAVVLEVQRPRRGTPVFALLTAAGLLRPEAWLLAGLYFLWMAWKATWPQRVVWALWTWSAALLWAATDFVVTGDPLFSLNHTSSSAEDLGRQRTLSELPSAVPDFFAELVKVPVALVASVGLVAALLMAPRRSVGPLVLFVTGLGTFIVIGVAGLSVIERYLMGAALALLVFAAVALGGWTMLERGSRARGPWAACAALLALAGVAFTVANIDLRFFRNELSFRGNAHDSLVTVLEDPKVVAALKCGPLVFPNHKLVPDARWITGLPFSRVRSRAEELRRGRRPARRGVAVVVTSRFGIFKQAWTDDADPAIIQAPPADFAPVARSDHYAAYARC